GGDGDGDSGCDRDGSVSGGGGGGGSGSGGGSSSSDCAGGAGYDGGGAATAAAAAAPTPDDDNKDDDDADGELPADFWSFPRDGWDGAGEFVERSRAGQDISGYHAANVNAFMRLGGLSVLLRRVAARPLLEPAELRSVVHVLTEVFYILDSQFDGAVMALHDALIRHFRSLTPERLKAVSAKDRGHLFATVHLLQGHVGRYWGKPFEHFTMDVRFELGLALLRCPALQQRIAGLSDIRNSVAQMNRRLDYSADLA
ncbi:unnamed protein product, partial [Phaeothamnion confervicola]